MSDSHIVLFLCSGNFYRSRFAEALFNHEAPRAGLSWHAESRGFRPHIEEAPLSPYIVTRLEELSIAREMTRPAPKQLCASDLEAASLIVALYEKEHRPKMGEHFGEWTDQIRYWNVPDIDEAPPSIALPIIEIGVEELIAELVRDSAELGSLLSPTKH